MSNSECTPAADFPLLGDDAKGHDRAGRLRAVIDAHYDFVWRTVRCLGLSAADADDATQQVMCVLARRADDVRPGAERAFLFSTATQVVRTFRRSVWTPVDCGKMALCGASGPSVCTCTATSCTVPLAAPGNISFDMQLASGTLTGSTVGEDGSQVLKVHLTKQ